MAKITDHLTKGAGPAPQTGSFDPAAFLSGWPHLRVPQEVAVVGCGRWGKILCQVLTEFSPPLTTIHLVAERNAAEVTAWVEGKRADAQSRGYDRVLVTQDIQAVLRNERIEAGFVTKMAAEHYRAARQLLEAGKHVFVEKPFVLRTEEAHELIHIAEARQRTLVVGYEYMLARFLHHFHGLVTRHLADVSEVEMVWEEPAQEVKGGIRKQPDWSSTIITNLYPHVLSQLCVLLGRQPITLEAVESTDHYWQAAIRLRYGTTPVTVRLNKAGLQSCRTIQVGSSGGERIVLDYTEEPGTITLNGHVLPQDPQARTFPRPLADEIAHFFAQINMPAPDLPTLAKNSMHIVEAIEDANTQLVAGQMHAMRTCLLQECPAALPTPMLHILRHHMLQPLLKHGLLRNPKDERVLDVWLGRTFRIVHRFSERPWTTQAEVLEQTGLQHSELRSLNAAIRGSEFLQQLMIREGIGQKYWATLIPVIQSGALRSVLTKTYQFPLRTGIYPGVSCMFFCSFCGRNPSARYQFTTAPNGNAVFEQIFAGMPNDGHCSVSFSGGLEPLTNPAFGELVRSAKRHGITVPLITNGFMLSPHYLERQEGLWDLDSLRVSLYGVDDETYYRVTKVRNAFQQVKRNVTDFLRLRNQRRAPLKFGLNFIVLPGTTNQVLKVLDLIEEINATIGNGRGIDFLTLREDFSVAEPEGLSAEERARLIEIFQEVHRRLTREPLGGLEVDFGYALMTLSEGVMGTPLAMVTREHMRPKAYPQISVVVDLLGDVYLYREAGFLERPGANRYRIGTVTTRRSLEAVIREFLECGEPIPPLPTDPVLLDAFDHIVTMTLNQAEADAAIGIPFNDGPVLQRVYHPHPREERQTVAPFTGSLAPA